MTREDGEFRGKMTKELHFSEIQGKSLGVGLSHSAPKNKSEGICKRHSIRGL